MKNIIMTMACLSLLFGLSFSGCSGDNILSSQYQVPVSTTKTDPGIVNEEYLSLEERTDSGRTFSRYGIGIDYRGDNGNDGDTSDTSGDAYGTKDSLNFEKP